MTEEPLVSVVIPVYNDPAGLQETLQSVAEQSLPAESYEVIVVDNNSTDHTRKVGDRFAEQHENVSVVVESDVQSSYAARNTGVERSTSDIIAFIDADMSVDPRWVAEGLRVMDEQDVDYMGCDVDVYSQSESLFATYSTLTEFQIEKNIEHDRFTPTCCLWVRRDVFDDVGKFDERLTSGGDFEFGNRVADAGYSLHFEPSIIVRHPARDTFRAILKKSFRVGKGSAQLARYYPDRFGSLGMINPITLISRMLSTQRSNTEATQPSTGNSHTRTERVAFSAIRVLEQVWYYSGRVSERLF